MTFVRLHKMVGTKNNFPPLLFWYCSCIRDSGSIKIRIRDKHIPDLQHCGITGIVQHLVRYRTVIPK